MSAVKRQHESPAHYNDSRLEVALELAEVGIRIFPWRIKSGRKVPHIKGWQIEGSSNDPEQIREWWSDWPNAEIGIPTGEANGISVLDIDVKDGKDGFGSLDVLGFDYESLNVFTQKTRSGGYHYYFRYEPRLKSQADKIAIGVDTRSAGGYVGFYGGRKDALQLGAEFAIGFTEFPEELIPYFADRISPEHSAEYTYDEIEGVLNRIPNEYDSRDDWLRIGMAVHSALDDDGFTLWDQWSQDYESYSAADTRAAWRSFGNYSGRQVSAETLFAEARKLGPVDCSAADFLEPGEDPEAELRQHRREIRKAAEAREEAEPCHLTDLTPADCDVFEPRPYVIKGLVSEGEVGQIIAPPNVGKSLFAAQLAYAVAQGKETFGMRVSKGPVLYVAPEDEYGMRLRTKALRLEYGDAENFHLIGNVSNLSADKRDFKALSKLVRNLEPRLIVIDTLRSGFPDAEENSSDGMAKVASVAQSLARSGAAVIIIHHGGKSDDARGRGSEALYGAADMSMHLSDCGGTVEGTLIKVRNGRKDKRVAFTIESRVMGRDCDGDPIEVPICVPLEAEDVLNPRRNVRLSDQEEEALHILKQMRNQASRDDFRTACLSNPMFCNPAIKPESQRKNWWRVCRELTEKRLIKLRSDYFVVVGSGADLFPDDQEGDGFEY